ncbi:uracil-DNA glycosylase%2C family 4 [Mycobacterium tuberculosis]|nr:uracil-DNA glycosylase%2C family 4 [Mycobacterium tuberculosis]
MLTLAKCGMAAGVRSHPCDRRLGGFAWQVALRLAGASGTPKPRFGHGVVTELGAGVRLLGCYHPSQQNMFTGRLTPTMLDDIFREAKKLAGIE